MPLLHEVWNFAAENIYPVDRIEYFDQATLEELEHTLRSNEALALADVVNPFLDGLGVSHTRFFDKRHQGYYMLRSLFSTRDLDAPELFTIGVQLDDKDPGVVRAVMEGSPAWEKGVRRGERIRAVDGKPFSSLLQWQTAGTVDLTIESQGSERHVELLPVRQGFHRAIANATLASRKIIDCRDRRIAYFHLWSGTHDVFLNSLAEFVSSAKDAGVDGFILDLRDGYGGAWYPYLDPFFPNRDDYFEATVSTCDERTRITADAQANPDAWAGPLAVIINGGTRSGKESLAYQFRKTGRATLFGSTTWGAFTGGLGAFAERDVNYLLFLAVSEMRLDDTIIEGVGIDPDVPVPDGPSGDAPLSAALDHLACEAPKGSIPGKQATE